MTVLWFWVLWHHLARCSIRTNRHDVTVELYAMLCHPWPGLARNAYYYKCIRDMKKSHLPERRVNMSAVPVAPSKKSSFC